ncbi:MAG TPA: hypothetical protein VMB80_04715 [Candidatus Acidoferrum sp.]|nr:hypothetical protein [Candidatus Acidoferrum sp.]
MNRSILIVICDFLLLSLLTFSADLSKMIGQDEGVVTVKADVLSKAPDNNGTELAAVMKQALAEEQNNREQLQLELTRARETARLQQVQFDQQLSQYRQLQQKQAELEKQYAAAAANIQALSQQLQSDSTENSQTREKLAARETELQKQKGLATTLQQQIELLNNRLQSADAEKRLVSSQVAMMQQQVAAEQAQNARLAESYRLLVTNSSALTREIRDGRGLTPNTIFDDFSKNRVQTTINAVRTGMFGVDMSRNKTGETVLVTDGANIYALCHLQDTPLTLGQSGTDWQGITGVLSHNRSQVPIHSLSFHIQDPRVVFMPITKAEATELGCKIFPVSTDPYKFQDAVLVGAQQGYYGQCTFQIDLTTPEYVKLISNKALYGKFNPTRGDLVFSRVGELMGVMANDTYCLVLHEFAESESLQFGPDLRNQHTSTILAELYSYADQLPPKLH